MVTIPEEDKSSSDEEAVDIQLEKLRDKFERIMKVDGIKEKEIDELNA